MFRVEFALAVDVVYEEASLADEVVMIFVDGARLLRPRNSPRHTWRRY